MRIFHLGDLHFGKIVNNFSMCEDQRFVLEQLYKKVQEEKPNVVIIAGDIFDRAIPTLQAVELANEFFEKLVMDLNTPVIAIAGNHDSSERIEYLSGFTKRNGLYIKGLLSKDIEEIILEDEFGNVTFYPIPFATPAIVREVYGVDTIKNYDDAMCTIIENINKNMDTTTRNVAIAHGHVCHYSGETVEEQEISESEKPLSIGGVELVNSKYFEDFAYTALGHLHGPQQVGSNKIRYSGSLLKYSFSEENQKKGVTIVDIDGDGNVVTQVYEFMPMRNMRTITGEFQDILDGNCDEGINKEDYVRFEITDDGELLDPMSKLRAYYPNAMELIRISKENSKNITGSSAAVQVRDKSTLSLFESFYKDVIGTDCEAEERDIMISFIEKAEMVGDFREN